jgi:tryptophan 2,3-dioxygenase
MKEPIHYAHYLQLPQLLNSQKLISEEKGQPCHDELLFIITHQTDELWFKLIHHELDSIIHLLEQNHLAEKDVQLLIARFKRVEKVVKLTIDQFDILETMTPLDFLDFREFLTTASGFQSFQFRALEIKLGVPLQGRHAMPANVYINNLIPTDREKFLALLNRPHLLTLVENWLERMPFMNREKFDFWQVYRELVEKQFLQNPCDEATQETLKSLIDCKLYNEKKAEGFFKISHRAFLAALFINLYRDEPLLQRPHELLNALINLDDLMANWRHRHAQMAKRMLGSKIGTGGSSGHQYLSRMAQDNRVFTDLVNLSSFLLPKKLIPPLPENIKKELGFYFQ